MSYGWRNSGSKSAATWLIVSSGSGIDEHSILCCVLPACGCNDIDSVDADNVIGVVDAIDNFNVASIVSGRSGIESSGHQENTNYLSLT